MYFKYPTILFISYTSPHKVEKKKRNAKLEISIVKPIRDVKQEVIYTSLEFREEVQAK